ncbi:geminin coiled-coil domain-containing protein 1 isoform X2 [Stigmatopora argus]
MDACDWTSRGCTCVGLFGERSKQTTFTSNYRCPRHHFVFQLLDRLDDFWVYFLFDFFPTRRFVSTCQQSVVQRLRPVSVSMETLTPTWTPVYQGDVINHVGAKGHNSSNAWDCILSMSPPTGGLWIEQQRNKQLEDKLLRREEELSRLQDENEKLRRFLRSPFVGNLVDGVRQTSNRKWPYRNESFRNSARRPLQVSGRVCRNLSAEFDSAECLSAKSNSRSALDLWVLRTLGLKDPDTVDVSGTDRDLEETPFGDRSRTPRGPCEGGHPDLAFSTSLSPTSSVKTLSYPQGQAFVSRDPQGRCNFTWLPAQTSTSGQLDLRGWETPQI